MLTTRPPLPYLSCSLLISIWKSLHVIMTTLASSWGQKLKKTTIFFRSSLIMRKIFLTASFLYLLHAHVCSSLACKRLLIYDMQLQWQRTMLNRTMTM
jgi:hypothetical protein